jgi:methionyl-tRNA formyltransferase
MNYNLTVFGAKDTTYQMIEFIENNLGKVDLIVTIDEQVLQKSNVAGFQSLGELAERYGIELFAVTDYTLQDEKCRAFFTNNRFELGISMGWQRLIPGYVLDAYVCGIFGFHGSCGYLPYGRGRSPLNWSIINGDSRVIMNLFQYDKYADSPNIYANVMFEINEHDTIRTVQFKNLLCAKELVRHLWEDYERGTIAVHRETHDFDCWYNKRGAEDGKIDFRMKTRDIYNLIRGVTRPFPGAFAFCNEKKVVIWNAVPFDRMLDFSKYAPGEVIDVFDDMPVVRTVDGSLLLREYECDFELKKHDVLG